MATLNYIRLDTDEVELLELPVVKRKTGSTQVTIPDYVCYRRGIQNKDTLKITILDVLKRPKQQEQEITA